MQNVSLFSSQLSSQKSLSISQSPQVRFSGDLPHIFAPNNGADDFSLSSRPKLSERRVQNRTRRKQWRRSKGLRLRYLIPAALAAVILPIAAYGGYQERQIPDDVTVPNAFSIEGDREWTFEDFDLDVHQTDTGWVVQGGKNHSLDYYKFNVDRTATGWEVSGGEWTDWGDYNFSITSTSYGYEISGDKAYDIWSGYDFTAERTLTGFTITGGQELGFGYHFTMSETRDGWLVEGGQNYSTVDFSFNIARTNPDETMSIDEEEALATAFPVILAMIQNAEIAAEDDEDSIGVSHQGDDEESDFMTGTDENRVFSSDYLQAGIGVLD